MPAPAESATTTSTLLPPHVGQSTPSVPRQLPINGSPATLHGQAPGGVKGMAFALVCVLLYLASGMLIFSLSGMDPLDALYFSMVTLTTVGYGDVTPHKDWAKLFTCLYILVGVALIGAFLSQVIEVVMENQEQILLAMIEEDRVLANQGSSHQLVQEQAQRRIKANIKAGYLKVLNGLILLLVLVAIGFLVFVKFESISAVDAIYLTVVSASTVGYGDISPNSPATKMFAFFFLPLTTLILAKIVSDYTEMRMDARTEIRQKRILMATITREDFREMDVDGDGQVSRLEFICRTLVNQGKVSKEDVDQVKDRFDQLDKDKSGILESIEVFA